MEKYQVLPINDKSDEYFIEHDLGNLPTCGVLCGKSGLSGKSSLMINVMEFYKEHFKSENIFIFSPTIMQEKWQKAISYFDIPEENIFQEYSDMKVRDIYKGIEERFYEAKAEGIDPEHSMIIFDDLGASQIFKNKKDKKNNIIDELVMFGRHVLISSFFLVQLYTQLSTDIRENVKFLCMFASSYRQWEHVCEDHMAGSDKKEFMKIAKKCTKEKHDFMFITLNNKSGHPYWHNFTKPVLVDEDDEIEKNTNYKVKAIN